VGVGRAPPPPTPQPPIPNPQSPLFSHNFKNILNYFFHKNKLFFKRMKSIFFALNLKVKTIIII
jgi:hypothetical protein